MLHRSALFVPLLLEKLQGEEDRLGGRIGHPDLVFPLDGWELKLGDLCPKGSQLRPHIVWFGEEVPNIMQASSMVRKADILIVIGTSLQVYPAAGLLHHAPHLIPKYLIDPKAEADRTVMNLKVIREKATIGVVKLVEELTTAE